jgi:hypothetical protein
MSKKRTNTVHTDESALAPSASVNRPYSRTSVRAAGHATPNGGLKAQARIDVEGGSDAPTVVALGLGLCLGLTLAVVAGLLALGGTAAACLMLVDTPSWIGLILSLAAATIVTTGLSRVVTSRFTLSSDTSAISCRACASRQEGEG